MNKKFQIKNYTCINHVQKGTEITCPEHGEVTVITPQSSWTTGRGYDETGGTTKGVLSCGCKFLNKNLYYGNVSLNDVPWGKFEQIADSKDLLRKDQVYDKYNDIYLSDLIEFQEKIITLEEKDLEQVFNNFGLETFNLIIEDIVNFQLIRDEVELFKEYYENLKWEAEAFYYLADECKRFNEEEGCNLTINEFKIFERLYSASNEVELEKEDYETLKNIIKKHKLTDYTL